ncbi:CBS domain-containing protein [Planctomycetota bacterium]
MTNRKSGGENLTARDIMVPFEKLTTLTPEMDALSALRKLLKRQISGAPVIGNDREFLGVFSEKTSMQFLLTISYEKLPSSKVSAFMNTDRDRVITENVDLLSIMDMFLRTPYRRLPVLNGDKLAGQISRRDVLTAATKALESPLTAGSRQLLYLSALAERVDPSARF